MREPQRVVWYAANRCGAIARTLRSGVLQIRGLGLRITNDAGSVSAASVGADSLSGHRLSPRAIRMLPYLLFSLPAGALVDHWDRRRVMLILDTGRALALGSIPIAVLFGRLSVAQIFLVALIEGTLFVFFDLAELAALPSVVPPKSDGGCYRAATAA